MVGSGTGVRRGARKPERFRDRRYGERAQSSGRMPLPSPLPEGAGDLRTIRARARSVQAGEPARRLPLRCRPHCRRGSRRIRPRLNGTARATSRARRRRSRAPTGSSLSHRHLSGSSANSVIGDFANRQQSGHEQFSVGSVCQLTRAGCKKVIREVASGAKTDRAQLCRLLAQLAAGDVLMVTRLDRIAR
jgi:Resolvase, N terminal domain